MMKGIKLKQEREKTNVDKETFEFLHKEILKAFSIDLAGNKLFDAEKFGEISRVEFSKDGIPKDFILTLKKEIKGKIVNINMSVKNSTKEELERALKEHFELS